MSRGTPASVPFSLLLFLSCCLCPPFSHLHTAITSWAELVRWAFYVSSTSGGKWVPRDKETEADLTRQRSSRPFRQVGQREDWKEALLVHGDGAKVHLELPPANSRQTCLPRPAAEVV